MYIKVILSAILENLENVGFFVCGCASPRLSAMLSCSYGLPPPLYCSLVDDRDL